jgi:hypothetical protein
MRFEDSLAVNAPSFAPLKGRENFNATLEPVKF